MNSEEKICHSYQTDVKCFQKIPNRFEFDGINDESCSFVFPPGYSIYVEEFILDNSGPDNFVLLDGRFMEYKAKLKWNDRQRNLWLKLDKNGNLNDKFDRRPNNRCVKTLKVRNKGQFLMIRP